MLIDRTWKYLLDRLSDVAAARLAVYLLVVLVVSFVAGCGSGSSASSTSKAQSSGGSESGTVSSVSEMGAGDIYYVNFNSSGTASIDFSGGVAGAEYIMIIQSTSASSSYVSVASASTSDDPSGQLDDTLREAEASLSEYEFKANVSASLGKAFTKSVGDASTFRVLSSISSTTSYRTVTATAKCVESHIIVYVDNEVTSANLSDSDIATLCDQFEYSANIEESILGTPSDINNDGHVVVLISPAINRLGASGGGIITGYFWAGDLYNNSSSNPASNQMEIVYILAPDPTGTYGTAISKNFALSNLMPAVVPHELQHAISYNEHVFVNGGSTEASWLNEALSHFSEDLVGFGQENPSRVELFLDSPEATSLVPTGSPDLSERGAGYLFMRYMYEQASSGTAFLSAIEATSNTGETNVVAAFNSTDANFDEWKEFTRRWITAVALTNMGITTNSNFKYDDRSLNATTGEWNGVCLVCDTEDGRGTILAGPSTSALTSSTVSVVLSGTSNTFYTISSPPSSITIQGTAGSAMQGVLVRSQ